jgi:diadenylate cyclase
MISEALQTTFLRFKDVISNFHFFPDILDILLVALLVYAVIVQLRRTQSIQVVKGIIFVAIVYALVSILNMSASSYIFNRLMNDIILIVVILFSGEIRQALEHMGTRNFGKKLPFLNRKNEEDELNAINAVCRACGAMSRNKVGSLILFERETLLGDLTKQAVMIDSETTFEMLCSIFYPKAPLHDGAVIINNGRIVAARCVVPMKNDRVITENVGTRHRAALEASLNSDCVAVVTSEETGIISVAVEGKLNRGISDSELRELLGQYLLPASGEKRLRKKKKEDAEKPADENAEAAGQTENAAVKEEF